MYNLLARGIEQEYLPMCKEFGISTVVYNPLAGGLLTGKHKQANITPGTRFDNNKLYQDRYWHEQYFQPVEQLRKIAQSAGRSLVSLALNWLLHHTASDCIILGASRLEQLNENLATVDDGPLSEDVLKACDEVWQASCAGRCRFTTGSFSPSGWYCADLEVDMVWNPNLCDTDFRSARRYPEDGRR